MTRKVFKTAIIALFPFIWVSAQHEFSINVAGGFGALSYKVEDGAQQKGGFGGQFGLGYRYQINRQWGAVSGIGLSMLNASFEAPSLNTSSTALDREEGNVSFVFSNALSIYDEKQAATLLQIPVMGQFLHTLKFPFGAFDCYANGGLKFGFPIGGQFSNSVGSIKNTVHYAEEDFTYETQTFNGFGTFNNRSNNGDLNFKVAILFALEWGVKFKLNEELSLYAGAFFDMGLNNIHTIASAMNFVEFNETNPRDFSVNSIIHSKYEGFTEKISPIAFGVKVALALEK